MSQFDYEKNMTILNSSLFQFDRYRYIADSKTSSRIRRDHPRPQDPAALHSASSPGSRSIVAKVSAAPAASSVSGLWCTGESGQKPRDRKSTRLNSSHV